MKVLVLGAGGMAGHVVSLYLREHSFEVDTLSAKNKIDENTFIVDALDLNKLKKLLIKNKYDAVINCIGILVKQSDERKDLATYLNSFLPHFLENFYQNTKTKIIHLSTDCVFSGLNAPYKEDSFFDGELFYDRSKALGEIINNKDLTFRMSIIGPDMHKSGIGLFNWFYQQTGEITGYTTAIWNGITTLELAKGIKAAIDQNLVGLYHLVPDTNISKYELLNLFKKTFSRDDIEIKPAEVVSLNKTLVNTRNDFDFVILDYEAMIKEMKSWIINHSQLYKHYHQ